jgi:cysteine-S-conjugate beta-lyase
LDYFCAFTVRWQDTFSGKSVKKTGFPIAIGVSRVAPVCLPHFTESLKTTTGYLKKINMVRYNFDKIINREGTHCIKWDARKRIFGREDILPMWVADMDFETPGFIVDAIHQRSAHPVYGYSFRGDSYFQAVTGWLKRRHRWPVKKEWISFSPGVVAGLTVAIRAFSQKGDGIIVQPPVYYPFFNSVKGSGRIIVENPLKQKNKMYFFDLKDLSAKVDEKTKILILCNPHNPGGMVWEKEELRKLSEFCLENGILVISDEIHSDLVFSGHTHTPTASLSEKIALNTIACIAPSKTFNIAGLASSVVIIPDKKKREQYEQKMAVGHLNMGNIFGSVALEAAYTHGDEWVDHLVHYLEENSQFLESFIENEIPGIKTMKPEGTYLAWLDFRNYGMSDKELSEYLVDKAKIGLNNGAKFGTGGEGWMRLNFGCPRKVLEEGLIRLKYAFG